MPRVHSPIVTKILLVTCGIIFALLSSELLLRAFNVDLHLLRKTLYYQCALPQLHRTSSDAQRLFELVPNSSARGMAMTHPKETKYNHEIDVSINAFGFRGKSFAPTKKPGIFRIAIFGGSNTFGVSVSDDDTYPAQMQKIFDEKYPGKVEVWNAGICAYVMSQDVAYAETVIKKFDPDLVILQDTNKGRRGFHINVTLKELKKLFDENNELIIENTPFWGRPDVPVTDKRHYFLASIHYSLFRVSALYRTIHLSFFTIWLDALTHNPANPIKKKYNHYFGFNGQNISIRELNLFTERHKDKKVILFFIKDFAHENGLYGVEMRDNMGNFVLNTKDKPPEYLEIHPPSYVYAWYARELCNFLVQKGYIPVDGLQHKEAGFSVALPEGSVVL